ncbi:MAG TPA: hypothetical protein VHB25_03435 [Gemmatimonadaceae bacterium]|nr:hypothetical protein [Gemmatimonadaceae bacterium]
MRTFRGMVSFAVLAGAGIVACGPSKTAREAAESATAAIQNKAVTAAGEVFGARREAQAMFDSARARFVAKDNAGAATNLRDAATFTRQQAGNATGSAKDALTASADELDRLATSVAAGEVKNVEQIDRATGRAQLAEASFHSANAMNAWKNKDLATAGAELLMLTDHYSRGASDLGQPLTGPALATLTNARTLAVNLTKGATVVPADVDSTLASLNGAVNTMIASARKITKE